MQPYRRITHAVGLMMFLDATLYLAILPLLPRYQERFGLGTVGTAVLLASYPLATPLVSLSCIRLLPRLGGKRITLGSSIITTVATICFAVAPNAEVLIGARFFQGLASGTVWAGSMAWVTHNAPPDRRGREAGIVMGMLATGSVVGPGIGALAAWIGFAPAFLGVAVVGAAAIVLIALAPAGRPMLTAPPVLASVRRAAGNGLVRGALAVSLIDTLAFGAVDVLVPIDLGHHGRSTGAIALAVAAGAVLGAAAGPFAGRRVDAVGAQRVAIVAVLGVLSVPILLALLPGVTTDFAVLVIGSPVFAVVGSSMFPLASAGADEVDVPHVVVSGLLGAVWAAGFTTSAFLAGALASVFGQTTTFAVAAVCCVPLIAVVLVGSAATGTRAIPGET